MKYPRAKRAFATLLIVSVTTVAWGGESVRRAVAAGPMYAAEPQALVESLDRLFAEADPPAPLPGRLTACVVPHDPYGLSGRVAAAALKRLQPGQFDKVLILGACHKNIVETCSIASTAAYMTPLGPVPLSGKELSRLCRSRLFSARGLRYEHNDFLRSDKRVPLHEVEHSIEVVLPFLQRKLGRFSLLPVLVGDLNRSIAENGGGAGVAVNKHRVDSMVLSVAERLRSVIDERTLIIVSTNLTHFGNDFAFRPPWARTDAKGGIEALDKEAIRLILAKDRKAFEAYLDRTGNPICGAMPLMVLMELLPSAAEGQLLDSDNSANKLGALRDDDTVVRSVSYAAINFHVPERPVSKVSEGPAPTLSRETMEAWEEARPERETAEASKPKVFTMRLVGDYEGEGSSEDAWIGAGEDPHEDSSAPAEKVESKAAPAPDKKERGAAPSGRATTIRIKGGKVSVTP